MQGELFDGFPITAVPVLVNNSKIEISGRELENNLYEDYEDVKRFYTEKMSREKARKDPKLHQILKESMLFQRHMDRRLHSIIFRKCVRKLGDEICKHCQENPPQAPEKFWADMPRKDRGGLFYDPVEDEANPGHFKTFSQMILTKDMTIVPDGNVPDVKRCMVSITFNILVWKIIHIFLLLGRRLFLHVQKYCRRGKTYENTA